MPDLLSQKTINGLFLLFGISIVLGFIISILVTFFDFYFQSPVYYIGYINLILIIALLITAFVLPIYYFNKYPSTNRGAAEVIALYLAIPIVLAYIYNTYITIPLIQLLNSTPAAFSIANFVYPMFGTSPALLIANLNETLCWNPESLLSTYCIQLDAAPEAFTIFVIGFVLMYSSYLFSIYLRNK